MGVIYLMYHVLCLSLITVDFEGYFLMGLRWGGVNKVGVDAFG
jgi:hypothetical protein